MGWEGLGAEAHRERRLGGDTAPVSSVSDEKGAGLAGP
jgi:hypothetical protein